MSVVVSVGFGNTSAQTMNCQLAVLHGVLFHTHEGSVCICLGKAVPASAGVQFPMIVLQPPDVFVKRFRQPLQWRFASADAVHEDDGFRRAGHGCRYPCSPVAENPAA